MKYLLIFSLFLILSFGFIPKSSLKAPLYPKWAHSHWVWLSSDQANQSSVLQFVQGFLDYNISVGGVDIDSMWAGVNDFVWNRDRYPNPQQMIDHFHSLGMRVICWTTSLVDTDTPIYSYAKEKGYFLNHGRTVKWWHGEGSFIDYTNPEGLAWWHQQLDKVLDMGLDGFKCDGTDPYTLEFVVIEAHSGIISERDYANSYYQDFWNYSRSKNDEALIMSRPVDSYKEIYWKFSPRDVVFSGWVGDQNPDFDGLQDALRNMFHSAWDNYVGFGSDIGGYRYGPGELGRTKTLFIRWAQLGAFCALMENGGNKEHRPWKFDTTNQTVDIYRFFVDTHYQLQTYLYSAGTTAYETGVSIMKPVADWTIFNPSSWDYWLWKDVFVCPMVDNTTVREVIFPKGNDYVDWYNNSLVYQGGSKVNYSTPLSVFPVFHRRGSLLPLEITKKIRVKEMKEEGQKQIVGLGDENCADSLTLLLLHPKPSQKENINVREWKGDSQEISYLFEKNKIIFTITPHSRNLLFCIKGITLSSSSTDSSFSSPFFLQTDLHTKVVVPSCGSSCDLHQLRQSSFAFAFIGDALWIRIPGHLVSPGGALLTLLDVQNTFTQF